MNLFLLIVAIVFAPGIYWGLGRCITRPLRVNFVTAALLGCWAFGWGSELAYILGISVQWLTYLLLGASTLVLFLDFPTLEERALFKDFYFYYLAFFAVTLLLAYPGVGNWGGDWFFHMEMGQIIRSGRADPAILGRTPLFGSSNTPLVLFSTDLIALQLLSCVIGAGSVLIIKQVCSKLWQTHLSGYSLCLLFLCPILPMHVGNTWPKLIVAAFVLCTLVHSLAYKATGKFEDWLHASLYLALAMSLHQSAVIFIPAIVALAWRKEPIYRITCRATALVVMGMILCAPFEMWSVLKFGLSAKVEGNAAISYRSGDGLLNFLWNFVMVFVPALPTALSQYMTRNLHSSPLLSLLGKIYYCIDIWVSSILGTLIPTLLPFAPLLSHSNCRKKIVDWVRAPNLRLTWVLVLVTILFHNALVAHFAMLGLVQAGLLPLQILLLCGAVVFLQNNGSKSDRRTILVLLILIHTLPFAALQLPALGIFGLKDQFPQIYAFFVSRDADARYVVKNQVSSLGLTLFPWGLMVGLAWIALSMRWSLKLRRA